MGISGDVADAIRAYASEHGLRPGDRLPPERALAMRLGVSRPALREAMRRLVDVGMLRSRQGSGTFVAEVDLDELLEVRARLEPLAARLAAVHATAADRSALGELLTSLHEAIEDAPRFAELDLTLHTRMAEAGGNRVLMRTLEDLDQLLRISRARTSGRRQTRMRALHDLGRLVQAIATGDAGGAEAAMVTHLRQLRDGQAGAARAS